MVPINTGISEGASVSIAWQHTEKGIDCIELKKASTILAPTLAIPTMTP